MHENGPSKKENIVCRKIGNETVLYNSDTRLVHVINSTAGTVWQLCDGRHDAAQIERGLRQRFAVGSKDSVHEDIGRILAELKKYGLFEEEKGRI